MSQPTVPPDFSRARRALWLAALKPPMYSVAVMPIVVGSLLARQETGVFNGYVFGLLLLAAVLLVGICSVGKQ